MFSLPRIAVIVLFSSFAVWLGANEVSARRDLRAVRAASARQEEELISMREQLVLMANVLSSMDRNAGAAAEARAKAPPPPPLAAPLAPAPRAVERGSGCGGQDDAGPALPSDEVETAVEQSRKLVDTALANGQWTELDRSQFLANAWKLPPEERHALVQRFVVATNSGKLQIRTDGPPL